MKSYEIKLGIITLIISEYMVAVRTVRNAFKLVTQLVDQRRSLSWLSHCKREKVTVLHQPTSHLTCAHHRADGGCCSTVGEAWYAWWVERYSSI